MTLTDAAGLAGVLVILIAYAGAALGKLDPKRPLSLFMNLVGAGAILFSLLTDKFNLSATAMEGAWALVSAAGLVRWAVRRRPSP
jgi:hypothetical protein